MSKKEIEDKRRLRKKVQSVQLAKQTSIMHICKEVCSVITAKTKKHVHAHIEKHTHR